jgi:RNA polymerase sigma-70 factor (sigma-E family)
VDASQDPAFGEFVRVQWPALLRAAFLLTGDRGRAEDLVQETLTRTALAWGRATSQGTPGAYARRIMVNAHISSARRRRVTEVLHLSAFDVVHPVTDRLGDRDVLRRALAGLPARQQAAVVVRHYLGLSEQEAADALGCSVGTVKSLTSRGLARLREVMTDSRDSLNDSTRLEDRHA